MGIILYRWKIMHNELIENFANIQGLTYDEAKALVNAKTDEEILNNIKKWTTKKINSSIHLNRAQRRALKKQKKEIPVATTIAETAEKLNYIDLIEKLRKLNEEKETEINGENAN